ncbi:MAG: hypothetical protein ABSA44_06845 [Bacteroidota bacterium]|jgi:hypothetical protein
MQKILSLVLIVLLVTFAGCKKDSSSSPTNPITPASNLYGSGSLSFTAGSLGNLSFSGSWTGASVGSTGTAVEALTGKSGSDYGAIIYGYTWHSSTSWDNAMVDIATTGTPITTGTYTTNDGLTFLFTKGSTSNTDYSNEYMLTTGSCQLTSYSSSGMKGTFSGTATKLSDQTTVSITTGSFDVTFGTTGM